MLNSMQLSNKRDRVNDRVQSYVRIRPSSNFAHDNIEIIRNRGENGIQIHAGNSDNKYPHIPQSANHLQKSWRFDVDDVLYNADQSEVYATVSEKLCRERSTATQARSSRTANLAPVKHLRCQARVTIQTLANADYLRALLDICSSISSPSSASRTSSKLRLATSRYTETS